MADPAPLPSAIPVPDLARPPFDPRWLMIGALLVPALTCLWWTLSLVLTQGVQPARGAGPLLALLAGVLIIRPPRAGWHWSSPWLWLGVALIWQVVGWFGWAESESREPGLLWLGERLAAFCGALGLATAMATRPEADAELLTQHRRRCAQTVAGIGGLLMCLAGLSQLVISLPNGWIWGPLIKDETGQVVYSGQLLGSALHIGFDAPWGNPNFNIGGILPLLGAGWGLLILDRRIGTPEVLIATVVGLVGWVLYHTSAHNSPTLATWEISLLPLLIVLILQAWRALPWWILIPVAFGSVCTMWVGTKVPWHPEQATMATWVGTIAMIGSALVIRLTPARFNLPLVASGTVVAFGLWLALVFAIIPLPAGSAPSTGQRLEMWRSAILAFEAHPVLGTGVGSAITVINRQEPAAENWLWVPGYAEHAHCEYLEWLVDGGAPLLILLLIGCFLLIKPLWKRRADPAVGALLIAWIGVAAHAAVESHLSQIGPVMGIGLLAGLTWSAVPIEPGKPAPLGLPLRLVGIFVSLLILVQCVRDFSPGEQLAKAFGLTGNDAANWTLRLDGGTPTMVAQRCDLRLRHSDGLRCYDISAAEMALRTSRLGPEDVNLTREASYHMVIGEWEAADELLCRQARRLPTDGECLGRLTQVYNHYMQTRNTVRAQELADFITERAERAVLAMGRVPPNLNRLQFRKPLDQAITIILGAHRIPQWSTGEYPKRLPDLPAPLPPPAEPAATPAPPTGTASTTAATSTASATTAGTTTPVDLAK